VYMIWLIFLVNFQHSAGVKIYHVSSQKIDILMAVWTL
jgi:hypothetical protein